MKIQVSNRIMQLTMKRISTMTDKSLETRIFKMTNLEKLEAMRCACSQLGMRKLAVLAKEKLEFCKETL